MQPDTIIPSPANPQSWNRFSYVENSPLNYADASGGFKCVNATSSYDSEKAGKQEAACHKAVNDMLALLEEQGGEEGKAVVSAFRRADTIQGCNYCEPKKDLITITIVDGDGSASYNGANSFSITAGLLEHSNELDSLVNAGQLGHEIVHLTQDDPLDQLLGIGSASLYDEIEAYDIQSKIYQNMGLTPDQHGTVSTAAEIASYRNKSAAEILQSNWAMNEYQNYPLHPNGNRGFDNSWYVDWPKKINNSPYFNPINIPR